MSRGRFKRTKSRLSAAELSHELQDADISLTEAVVAGCALVAYADGWVAPEETLRMRALIMRFEPAKALGSTEVLRLFEEVTLQFADDHETGEKNSFDLVSRLMGRLHESRLLIDICCGIADADGYLDAAERDTLLKLCNVLQIAPEAHGL